MALYINDAEVSRLADGLSKATGASKTEIVRRLLQEEVRRVDRARTAPERLRRLNEISREAARIAKRGTPWTYSKQDADELFAYLGPEAGAVSRRSRKRKTG